MIGRARVIVKVVHLV